MNPPSAALLLPARLSEVRRTKLLDTGSEEPFDRLTRLACELLDAPLGFVTVVDERRSFWKSCIGVPATGLADRQNPVGESFCQYVIAADGEVLIEDARLNPMTQNNPAIESMGVIAWAGFPVRSPNGQVLGTFCVVDGRPRRWSEQDRRTLEVLAHAASGEVALRIAVDEVTRAAELAHANAAKYRLVAQTLREALAPQKLPEIGGLDVAAAQRLGNDSVLGGFYDGTRTPTGWALFLGSVRGQHGAPEARTSALAKHALLAGADRASSPGIVLSDLHAALRRGSEETGETHPVDVAYAALRREDDAFVARVCTAGDTVAFLRRSDGTSRRCEPMSGPLGTAARPSLKIEDLRLRPGDDLLMFTTGTGAQNASVHQVLAGIDAADAHELAVAALDGVSRVVDMDDAVAVAVRIL